MKRTIACLAVLVALSGLCSAGPVVELSDGRSVEGVSYADGTIAFLGVPFATAARWTDPQPASWSGLLSATEFGPYCPQKCELPPGVCPVGGQSENCLNLNVFAPSWAPAKGAAAALPVMVFFYGGGYLIGGAETPLYNGSALAASKNPVVVVTINYRLGALGFFNYGNATGNFGMKDQIASLQWVRANVAAFGGDPSNVLIFGQSAGGMSTMSMLLSPPAQGLFHKACIHSDPTTLAYLSRDEVQTMSGRLVQLLGCAAGDMACLLAVPADKIVATQLAAVATDPHAVKAVFQLGAPWEPWVDGVTLAGQPLQLLPTGDWNKVPVMLGSVNNEGTMFVYGAFPVPLDRAAYVGILEFVYGAQLTPRVLAMYPSLPAGQDNRVQLSQLVTDYAFVCTIRNCSAALSHAGLGTYLWHFNHSIDDASAWGPDFAACAQPGQVCHGSELPFVFGSLTAAGASWGPGEQALSQSMVLQWTNFAYTNNPNSPTPTNVPAWQQYSPAAQNDFLFQIGAYGMEQGYRASYCNFWDAVGYASGSYYGVQAFALAAKSMAHIQWSNVKQEMNKNEC